MSWGVALRNAIGLGLGGIPSLRNAPSLRASLAFNFLSGLLDQRITFTRASTATQVNSTGLIESVAIDTPREDYDPVTLAAKGLLIEEQRTNICLYSNDLSQATWAKGTTVSVTYDTTTAPDGTTTADTITVVSGADTGVHQSIACSSSTAYTFSLYVKLGTMVASDYKIAIYDNTNAAFIAVDIVPTQTPSSAAWTKVTYTFTTPATCVSVRPYCFRNSLSAATSVNVWGMQLEQGEFATSYIPTTTTALTRAADVATMTGDNFSSWFNQTQGTFFVEYQGIDNVSGATRRAFEIGNTGSSNNRYLIGYSATNQTRTLVVAGGVTQADIYVNATQNNVVKAASAYAANNINLAANGTIGTLDTSATIPTVSTLWLGATEGSAANTVLNGHIRSFSYYSTRLSDAQLQSLTTLPPLLWTPAQISTALWLDASDAGTIVLNGSTVSQWNDKSGNGRNFSQATAASQPVYSTTGLNGKPQLQFASDSMAFTGSIPVAGVSAFIVGKLLSTTGINRGVWSASNGTANDFQAGGLLPWSSGFSGGLATGADAFYNGAGINNKILAMDTTYVYEFVSTQGIYTDGTLRFAGNAGSGAITLGFMVLGGRAYGATVQYPSNCEMSEVVLCPSILTTADREKMEGYLAWKWGLQANLPVGHPYKSTPPTV